MPAGYLQCTKKVQKSGKSESSAHAICRKANAGNIKKYSKKERKEYNKLAPKAKNRNLDY